MRSKVRRSNGSTRIALVIGGLVFLTVGLLAGWFLAAVPVLNVLAARSWESVDCKVVASRVGEASDEDGTTYKVQVEYAYTWRGTRHQGDRYDFDPGWSSGRAAKQAVVDALPAGTRTACWVDPDDPDTSVMDPSPGLFLLWALFPLPFLGAGGVLLALGARRARRRVPRRSGPRGEAAPSEATGSGRVRLKPSASPGRSAVGLGLGALLWNGFVWPVTLLFEVPELAAGSWCMPLFMLPFQAAGLVLIGLAIRALMASFLPQPRVFASTDRPTVGGSLELSWTLEARPGQFGTFTVKLVGTESATYRRGTDTVTDTHVFHDEVLYRGEAAGASAATVRFPPRTMHTFASRNNHIGWALVVDAEVRRWPDLHLEYAVDVRPGQVEEVAWRL